MEGVGRIGHLASEAPHRRGRYDHPIPLHLLETWGSGFTFLPSSVEKPAAPFPCVRRCGMQPEARLQRRIQNALKQIPSLFVFKVWGSGQMMAGLPDLVGCYQGMFFAFEVKTQDGKVTRRQEYVHELIRRAGGTVAVVRSPEEAIAALPTNP